MNSYFPQMPTPPEQRPKRDLFRERLQIAGPALGISFIFLFSMMVQWVIVALVSRFAPQITDADWYRWMLSSVSMYVFAMPLSVCFYRLSRSEPPEKKKLSLPVFLGLMAVCFGLTYAGNYIGLFVNAVISFLTGQEVVNELETLITASPLWVNLLCVGILAPILEEIFYRKMVIDRLRRYGDLPAILISGIAFGLIHGNFGQFFYAAMLGMVFGYIYINTGNILHTVLLHMAINLVGGVYSSEMLKLLDTELLASDPMAALSQNTAGVVMYILYLLFLMLVFVGSIVSAVLLIVYKRKPFKKAEQPLSAGEWGRVILLNPAVWVFAFLVLLLFLSSYMV